MVEALRLARAGCAGRGRPGENPDLAATGRSLAAAREQLRGQVNSSLMPTVDAGGEVSRKRALTMPGLPDPTKLYNYTGQIQARYEVDIFGAARFANEAEGARVEQRAFQLDSARRALAANIVTGAIRSAALAERVALTEKQAVLSRQVARDAQRRYELGSASQRGAGRRSRRRQPGSLAARAVRRMAVHPPRAGRAAGPHARPGAARPGLRRADAAGAGAGARAVGSAGLAPGHPGGGNGGASRCRRCRTGHRAALSPTEPDGLDGQGRIQRPGALSSAGSIWGMGASLTQPIFHGGQLLAERRAAKLMYEASIEQYKQAVLSAFQDVADTLARLEAGRRWPRPSPRAVPPNSPIAIPRAACGWARWRPMPAGPANSASSRRDWPRCSTPRSG